MTEYWQDNPPVHILVAAFCGYKRPAKTSAFGPAFKDQTEDLAALMQLFPDGAPTHLIGAKDVRARD